MSNNLVILAMAATLIISGQHRIPPEYEYRAGWLAVEHAAVTAGSLSGIVMDPSGAPRRLVLVECLTPDFKTRLDATLTKDDGSFRFHGPHKGTFHVRFRYPDFNDYLVEVHVIPHADQRSLRVKLDISN